MASLFSEDVFQATNDLVQEARDHYDRICKRILSKKIILGWILHDCLEEFADVSPEEIAERWIEGTPSISTIPVHAVGTASLPSIRGSNVEDSSIEEGTVWYDIRFDALLPRTNEPVGIMVNVEPQGKFYPGHPLLKRAAYYCARMISSQYGQVFSKSHYEKIQKVFSIWICPNPPTSFRNTITRYCLDEHQVVGEAHSDREDYDLVEMLLICPDGDRQHEGDGILRLLGLLLGSERAASERKRIIGKEFGIPLAEQLDGEVEAMGSLGEGLIDRGIQRGFQIGVEQGLEQGMTQGIAQGIEQGLKQGIAQGLEQGIAQGLEQGIEQGIAQGLEQGIAQGLEQGIAQGVERGMAQGMERGMEDGLRQATLRNIQSLTATMNISGQEAMDLLQIPLQEQADYLSQLN